MIAENCLLCRPADADREFNRVQVWADDCWRLTTSLEAETQGFSYLEPKRHVPYITDLAGEEAATFGPVMAKVTTALKEAAEAEVVYVYVFGSGIPHLHLHLAPHRGGDALNDLMIRGEVVERKLASGATALESKDFPLVPEADQRAVIRRAAALLDG